MSEFKHHVVVLELANSPSLPLDFPHTLEQYHHSSREQIGERIKNATIVIASTTPISAEDLDGAPNLQAVLITATGIDFVDRQMYASRGITVTNTPQSNVTSVAEHFLTLYFSCRRKIVTVHEAVNSEERVWVRDRLVMGLWEQGPPLSCEQETLGIIGYGHLGKKIAELAKAVGFGKVLVAERKGVDVVREGRVSFDDIIKTATTIVVCCPKDNESVNMIAKEEFGKMRKEALVINVARGGIINEADLVEALKSKRIFGAGIDVFDVEPAGRGTSPLIPDPAKGEEAIPNLTLSAHTAWFSAMTLVKLRNMLIQAAEAYAKGVDMLSDPELKKLLVVYKGKVIR